MAKYIFPTINHISDVLPAIEGMSEFNVGNGAPYFDVVDYHLMDSHTFKDDDPHVAALRRECRGLLFFKDGRIARRGFHKFFNMGETEDTFPEAIDLSTGYQLLEKLDGSMIAPFMSPDIGGIYWASMRGSQRYHERLNAFYTGTDFARLVTDMAKLDLTTIFEFCSPENRIVVDYQAPQMTLLAVRHLHTGQYHTRSELEALGRDYDVPLVQPLSHTGTSGTELMHEIGSVKDMEGAVLWQDGRPMVKIKGAWYLQLHKLLGHFKFEKDVAALILSGNSDDLMGILNAEKRLAFTRYQDALLAGIKHLTAQCEVIRDDVVSRNIDRKTFALDYQAPAILKGLLFRYFENLNGAEFFDDIRKKALSMTGSQAKWDGFKSSTDLDLIWKVEHLG